MTVVINEFEVVSEPPPKKSAEGEPPASSSGTSTPAQAASTPHDIRQILRYHTDRFARVRAH